MAKGPEQADLSNPPQQPTPQGPISPGLGLQDYNPPFQSFLPNDPRAMATGLTPAMLAGINRPPQSPQPGMPPQSPGPGGGGGGMAIPQLQMPGADALRGGDYMQRAQAVVDQANKTPGLDQYLAGRDQLAKIIGLAGAQRGGSQGGGGNYGSSGRSSGGGRLA